jgi:hypothetical protein
MKTLHTLALYREDLGEIYKNVAFDGIQTTMFGFFNTGVVLNEDIIIFIDDDGQTKILKNRYGKAING